MGIHQSRNGRRSAAAPVVSAISWDAIANGNREAFVAVSDRDAAKPLRNMLLDRFCKCLLRCFGIRHQREIVNVGLHYEGHGLLT